MTRKEFEASDAQQVIKLRDGRMGLCAHWNDRGILVDAYSDETPAGEPQQIEIPWDKVEQIADGALLEL